MEKAKKAWKFFSWANLWTIALTCILNAGIWAAFHGFPLIGLPEAEEVEKVTIVSNGTQEKTVTDEETVCLLVKAAHLLNYRLWGEEEGEPVITVTYQLKNGERIRLKANRAAVWWKDKPHALKEPDVFINVVQGLVF
jgi:hypothetical protein